MHYNYPEIGYTPANLRYLRAQMGISQEALAVKLGVTRITVTRWESDNGEMPHKHWCAARKLLENT